MKNSINVVLIAIAAFLVINTFFHWKSYSLLDDRTKSARPIPSTVAEAKLPPKQSPKWDYLIVSKAELSKAILSNPDFKMDRKKVMELLQVELSKHGQHGWELVTILEDKDFVFKRLSKAETSSDNKSGLESRLSPTPSP